MYRQFLTKSITRNVLKLVKRIRLVNQGCTHLLVCFYRFRNERVHNVFRAVFN